MASPRSSWPFPPLGNASSLLLPLPSGNTDPASPVSPIFQPVGGGFDLSLLGSPPISPPWQGLEPLSTLQNPQWAAFPRLPSDADLRLVTTMHDVDFRPPMGYSRSLFGSPFFAHVREREEAPTGTSSVPPVRSLGAQRNLFPEPHADAATAVTSPPLPVPVVATTAVAVAVPMGAAAAAAPAQSLPAPLPHRQTTAAMPAPAPTSSSMASSRAAAPSAANSSAPHAGPKPASQNKDGTARKKGSGRPKKVTGPAQPLVAIAEAVVAAAPALPPPPPVADLPAAVVPVAAPVPAADDAPQPPPPLPLPVDPAIDWDALVARVKNPVELPRYVPNHRKMAFIAECQKALAAFTEEKAKPVPQDRTKAVAIAEFMMATTTSLAEAGPEPEAQARRAKAKADADSVMKALQEKLEAVLRGEDDMGRGPEAVVDTLSDKAAKQVMGLVMSDNLSKAARVLQTQPDSNGPPPPRFGTAQDIAKMKALHPPPHLGLPLPELPANAPVVKILTPEVEKAIDDMKTGTAPGIDGWTTEMLQTMSENPACVEMLAELCTDIANGAIPNEARELLLQARLVPILKSVDPATNTPTWRPITCGNALLKLVARIMLAKVQKPVKELMGQLQRGVGYRGGVESVVHTAQAMLESNPSWIMWQSDAENAFNTQSRHGFLSKLYACDSLAMIWRFVDMCYARPSSLLLFDGRNVVEELFSAEGTRQGCGLAALLYALGDLELIQDAINQTGVQGIMLCDDGTFCGEQDNIYKVILWMKQHMYARTGKVLQMPKCVVFVPDKNVVVKPEIVALGDSDGLIIQRGGCRPVLGAAVGFEGRREFVDQRVVKLQPVLDRLLHPDISVQAVVLLLRSCVSSAVTFLFRCMPPTVTFNAANMLQRMIAETLAKKLVLPPDTFIPGKSVAGDQAFMPAKKGGLGFQDPVLMCHLAYFASVAQSLPGFVYAKQIEPTPLWDPPVAPNAHAFVAAAVVDPPAPRAGGQCNLMFESFAPALFDPGRVEMPADVNLDDTGLFAGDDLPAESASMATHVAYCLDLLRLHYAVADINGVVGQNPPTLPNHFNEFVAVFVNKPPVHLQRQLTAQMCNSMVAKAQQKGYWKDVDKRRLRLCMMDHSYSWLINAPNAAGLVMADPIYRMAVCLHVGLAPVFFRDTDAPIPCPNGCHGVDMRNDPYHELHCRSENKKGRNVMHDKVCCHYVRLCNLVGVPVFKTPAAYAGIDPETGQPNKQRPDLVVELPDGVAILDARGIDMMAPSYANRGSDNLRDLVYAGNNKVTKYQDIANRTVSEVHPIIFTTLGGVDKGAVAFTKRIMKNYHGGRKAQLVNQIMGEMVVGIMVDNYNIISKAFRRAGTG